MGNRFSYILSYKDCVSSFLSLPVWSRKHRDSGAFSFSLLKFVGVDASHPKSLTTARRSSDLDQHEKVNKLIKLIS